MSLFRKPNKNGIDCAAACDIMFDYLDGQLSSGESALLVRHIGECTECREELEQRKMTLNLIQNLELSVPDALYSNVMSLVDSSAQGKRKVINYRNKFIPIGGLAAACAVAVLVMLNRGGIPIKTGFDQVFMKNTAETAAVENLHRDFLTGTVTEGFYSMNKDYADGETEIQQYEGASSVLMLAPKLSDESTENISERSVNLLVVYLNLLKDENSDSAVLVCESDTLKEIITIGGQRETDSELFEFNAEDAGEASEGFNGYLNHLIKNGETFESYVPENGDFTTYYILIVNSGGNTNEVTD